ncbi:MAG: flagellar basal body rod protein FlgB [Candidatus Kapaibacteriota bacterium]|jgi:flagellar basal-body rod protein FlgB
MAIQMLLFKERLPLMHKALDAYSMRLTAIAENIANVNTVGYSPKRVKFEELFEKNISQMQIFGETKTYNTSQQSNKIIEPVVEIENVPEYEKFFSGQSNVNIDKEMAELAETQIRFRFVSRLLKRYFASLNSAITGIREM